MRGDTAISPAAAINALNHKALPVRLDIDYLTPESSALGLIGRTDLEKNNPAHLILWSKR